MAAAALDTDSDKETEKQKLESKEDFDSKTLEDIHKILEALKKSDDKVVQKILEDAFSNE